MNFKVRKKWQPAISTSTPSLQVYPSFLAKKIVSPPILLNFWKILPPPLIRVRGRGGVPTMIFQFHSCTHYIYVSVCPRKIWVWHCGNNFLYVLLAWCCFPKINMIQVCSKTPELVNDMPNYFSVKQFSDDFLMVSLIIFWS